MTDWLHGFNVLSFRVRTESGNCPGSARHRLEGLVAFRVVTGRRIINTRAMRAL